MGVLADSKVRLPAPGDAKPLAIVIYDATGNEVGRYRPEPDETGHVTIAVPNGGGWSVEWIE